MSHDYRRVTMMFSLPRSRSQWMRWFFGTEIPSWHDPLANCGHPRDLVRQIDTHLALNNGRLFIADTSALLFRDYLTNAMPGLQKIYVYRDPRTVLDSVRASTGRVHLPNDLHRMLGAMAARLQEHHGDQRYYGYHALDVEWVLQSMWTYAVGRRSPTSESVRQAMKTVIDVPMHEQQQGRDTRRFARLLQFSEITW